MFGHGKSKKETRKVKQGKGKKKWIAIGVGAFCVIGLFACNDTDGVKQDESEIESVIETETSEIAESTEIFSTAVETETENLSTDENTTESENESTIESTTESETAIENNAKKQSASVAESSVVEQSSIAQSDASTVAEQAAVTPSAKASTAEQPSNNSASNSGGENNLNTYNNVDQQNTSAQYVLNTHTKKIHYPSCSSVKKISPENYSTSNLSVEELINNGYSTCGNCFK
jgi:hypothetical protein